MSLHKLTAGDGYLYLVRQVAAADSTERGRSSLSDFYTAKGESPGRWLGSGLPALARLGRHRITAENLWAVLPGSTVTEPQMAALFGEGLHPNADAITAQLTARGVPAPAAIEATKLGRRFQLSHGEPAYTRALAVAYRDHNTAAGQRPDAPIDAPTRAAIRTKVARRQFQTQYGRGPLDARELTGFIARNTRSRAAAVAGYDLTFSPVKSVSALWALAPHPVAAEIEQAHDAAVADALAYLEDAAAFTRSGTNGVAQLDTEGLIAVAFTHRDSRAGGPDLHTHVAVSNKVATTDTEGVTRWLALDGRPLHRVAVAASELYNTRLEAHLQARLGIAFAAVIPRPGRRPVREIVGVPPQLLARFSARRAAIEARTAELSKQFQAIHGREPTHIEAIALAQQATLESREAKHEPRSLAEQKAAWRTQAVEVLGHAGLMAMLATTLSRQPRRLEEPTAQWIATQAACVIATVSAARSTWQRHHVLAEAQRVVRATGHATNRKLAQTITDTALAAPLSTPHARVADDELGEPHTLRRRDGTSVYSRHGTARYTSEAILAAEKRIVAAAALTGGRTASLRDVGLAVAHAKAQGRLLNPGQVALVTEMATGGRRVALALAPAGTGKTTAMTALSHAWRSSGGAVVGLAPTASAAIELATDLRAATDTVAKYVYHAQNPSEPAPDWFTVDHTTLVIVDEAGKTGTGDLDVVIGHALAHGASVRLVGDDGQLASISAGGVLRDIAAATDALTLSHVVRFASPAEGAASLALRNGDPAALGFYIDRHRVHVGAQATAAEMAYTAWRADIAAGRDSLLLAPTNDTVDALNARARLDRLTGSPTRHRLTGSPTRHRLTNSPTRQVMTPQVMLADQLAASAGDVVRTRRNARWLPMGVTDFVRNGYRFAIAEVLDGGALRVRHLVSGRTLTLPADYVAAHVTLGYAATIDNAQGLTAERCHVVGGDRLTRQLLYVALTRGRAENHLYLSTAETDPHRVLTPKATHPDTAVEVLSRALARDNAKISALTAARAARDPFVRLHAAADMYHDALSTAAHERLPTGHLDAAAELLRPGVTTAEAWPVLRGHLALLAAEGDDPAAVLADAVGQAPLDDATDPAAVLDWRIDPTGAQECRIGPLRWLPAIPQSLKEDPQWGGYLARRAALVDELAGDIRATVGGWTSASAPTWAKPLLPDHRALAAEIAVFRAAVDVPTTDTRLMGAPQRPARTRAVQTLLQTHATKALGRRGADIHRWRAVLDAIDPHIRTDGYWPQLAAHLAAAANRRPDIAHLVKTAAGQAPLPDELPAAALWWRLAAELRDRPDPDDAERRVQRLRARVRDTGIDRDIGADI